MSAADAVLEVKGLTVRYDKVMAVDAIDLVVRRGRVATIIGSNGAGKTTILKAISGLLRPADGSIRLNGEEIAGEPTDAIVVRGVSLVPEGRRLFPSMSVRENLIVGAYRRTDRAAVQRDLELVLGYFPMLAGRLDIPARSMSGGQQQMLAVGRALMNAPKLMMLDEPSIGLAPAAVQTIAEIITTISESGVEILLVEQNAHMALDVADDAWVLENGRVALQGSAQELARSDQVREAYLGL